MRVRVQYTTARRAAQQPRAKMREHNAGRVVPCAFMLCIGIPQADDIAHRDNRIILVVTKRTNYLIFSQFVAAKNFVRPSEGMAEWGWGGIPRRPRSQNPLF